MMEAFVYCWTDHKTNMLYIGSHKGSIDDGYICSSKYMMEEYVKRPSDFTRQIIAEGTVSDIRRLETKILQTVNAKLDEKYYNKHQNDGLFFDGWKKGTMSEEHRKNMSEAAKKRKRTPEHIKKLHEGRRNSKNSSEHNAKISKANSGINNPMYGKSIHKGKMRSLETIEKIRKAKSGIPCSEETKMKLREFWRKKREGGND